MNNKTKTTSTPCKIYIRSFINQINQENEEPYSQKGCALNVDIDENDVPESDEIIEFSTEGTVKQNGDLVEITYKENEELGMSNIESTLRFKKTRPTLVNLIRKGSAPASLVFDSHFPRQNCTYCLGNLPFSFCIVTNSVTNVFDDKGGKIILDYEIEMQGVHTEHNVYTLEYKI